MISNKAVQNKDYYTKEFIKDDYYNKLGNQVEGIGQWSGKGLNALNLNGEVKQKDFWNFVSGINPNSEEKLNKWVRNDKEEQGQDFVLNANKDFTLLMNVYENDPEMSKKLEEIWQGANKLMISEIENRLTYRDKKEHKEIKGAIVATWQHKTSRQVDGVIDPHIHSHNIFGNYQLAQDGTFKAVDFKRVFEDKLLIGSLAQEHIAKGVKDLGFEIEETKTGWAIKGINDDIRNEFSHRGQQIKKGSNENSTYEEKQKLANQKEKKTDYQLDELKKEWAKRFEEKGLTKENLNLFRNNQTSKTDITKEDILKKACQIANSPNFTSKHIDIALAQKSQVYDFDKKQMKEDIFKDFNLVKTNFKSKDNQTLYFNKSITSKNYSKNIDVIMETKEKIKLNQSKNDLELSKNGSNQFTTKKNNINTDIVRNTNNDKELPLNINLKNFGKLIAFGEEDYNFDKSKSKSFYVKLEKDNGETDFIWSYSLKQVIRENDFKIGDDVYFNKVDSFNFEKDNTEMVKNKYTGMFLNQEQSKNLNNLYNTNQYNKTKNKSKSLKNSNSYNSKTYSKSKPFQRKNHGVKDGEEDKGSSRSSGSSGSSKNTRVIENIYEDLNFPYSNINLNNYGKLIAFGETNYNFDKFQKESFYVKLEQEDGKINTIWSKILKQVIENNDMKIGDYVYFNKDDSFSFNKNNTDRVKNTYSGIKLTEEQYKKLGELNKDNKKQYKSKSFDKNGHEVKEEEKKGVNKGSSKGEENKGSKSISGSSGGSGSSKADSPEELLSSIKNLEMELLSLSADDPQRFKLKEQLANLELQLKKILDEQAKTEISNMNSKEKEQQQEI